MSSDESLKELKKITKILTFAYSEKIRIELDKIANTDNRKMIWVLIDGERDPTQIASIIKITDRAVRDFLNQAKYVGFIEYQRNNPPMKIIDYVPNEWAELLPKESTDDE